MLHAFHASEVGVRIGGATVAASNAKRAGTHLAQRAPHDGMDLDLNPHPERVSDAYADERIGEKIDLYESERPKVGLRNVDRMMKQAGVPAAVRLHYITAITHLGRQPASRDAGARARMLSKDLDRH